MIRQLPGLLSRAQSVFIKKCEKYGLLPDQIEFWNAWDEEGMENAISKRVITEEKELSRPEAIKETERVESLEREAEFVLQSLFHPRTATIRLCKRCGLEFATNYNHERYCSNLCRIDALREIGIEWSLDKTNEERWQGQPPSTISPETLRVLKDWAKWILAVDD